MITLQDYLQGREKLFATEYNEEIGGNAAVLLERVNRLLKDLNFKKPAIRSGWRPPSYNKTILNAAKKSNHMTGRAIDIGDPQRELAMLIATDGVLENYDLWMEDPLYTASWIHLQSVPPKSGKRIFKP